MAKMWAGRTDGVVSKIADDFNSSIKFDCRMYEQDIKGSMAHALMLAYKNIISQTEADTLIAGLEEILADIKSGKLEIDFTAEDIHMFVEAVLTERIGALGGYVEEKNLYNGSSYSGYIRRNLSMTVRIPADQADAFVDHISENANIVSSTESVDDVTLQYVDTESHVKALETEQERLLIEKMENECLVDDLIAQTGLPAGKVLATLTVLEVRGFVTRLPGRRVKRKG